MGQALYRKYRSKKLSEIVGQEHITNTLEKALASGRISHAYLFTGPRGVGKTSIARILAHEINGISYDDDSMHIDIVEIDAASNRRIDEIRDLRERVSVAPTSAKYKVYIIDEVHMLTKEAFNALLKTLEEPPAHVVFILATTDAHKLPETIVSRTQRYTFRPVDQTKVINHLKQIADSENISIDAAALELLAEHGEGSFRDSISMLDQASSRGEALVLEDVQRLLGIPPENGLHALLSMMAAGAGPAVSKQLNELYDQGIQAVAIAKALGQTLRGQILAGESQIGNEQLLPLMSRLLDVGASHNPERLLEIVLLECTGLQLSQTPVQPVAAATGALAAPAPQTVAATPPKPAEPAPQTIAKPSAQLTSPAAVPVKAPVTPEVAPIPEPTPPAEHPKPVSTGTAAIDMTIWPKVLDALKSKYNTLYGVVRMATPTFDGNELEIAFGFAFHQKRLTDPKNKKILGDILYELAGQHIHITCVVKKDTPPGTVPAAKETAAATPADLSAISDIFGGGEIMR